MSETKLNSAEHIVPSRQYDGLVLRSPLDGKPIIELRGYMGKRTRDALARLVFHQLYDNRPRFGYAQIIGESAWEWHSDTYDWRVEVPDELHATLHGYHRELERETVLIHFRLERFAKKTFRIGDNRWHLVKVLDEEVMKVVNPTAKAEVLSYPVYEQNNGSGVSEDVLRLVEQQRKAVRRRYRRTTDRNRGRRRVEKDRRVESAERG